MLLKELLSLRESIVKFPTKSTRWLPSEDEIKEAFYYLDEWNEDEDEDEDVPHIGKYTVERFLIDVENQMDPFKQETEGFPNYEQWQYKLLISYVLWSEENSARDESVEGYKNWLNMRRDSKNTFKLKEDTLQNVKTDTLSYNSDLKRADDLRDELEDMGYMISPLPQWVLNHDDGNLYFYSYKGDIDYKEREKIARLADEYGIRFHNQLQFFYVPKYFVVS